MMMEKNDIEIQTSVKSTQWMTMLARKKAALGIEVRNEGSLA